jgi:protein-S-isoprenylcysteine O-methyltransferase Ste14
MNWFYEWFFPAIWIVYLIYWQIAAVHVKATERMEPGASRTFRSILFLAAIVLLMDNHIPMPWLYRTFIPVAMSSFWVGAAITIAGLLFAVWARVTIGTNWSRSVTIKRGHELITSGPYSVVRHPIYTGILIGFLGTAIATTQYRGILAFLLVFLSLWHKLRLEERWMHDQFGPAYTAYARRTAALIPGIL